MALTQKLSQPILLLLFLLAIIVDGAVVTTPAEANSYIALVCVFVSLISVDHPLRIVAPRRMHK